MERSCLCEQVRTWEPGQHMHIWSVMMPRCVADRGSQVRRVKEQVCRPDRWSLCQSVTHRLATWYTECLCSIYIEKTSQTHVSLWAYWASMRGGEEKGRLDPFWREMSPFSCFYFFLQLHVNIFSKWRSLIIGKNVFRVRWHLCFMACFMCCLNARKW